MAQDSNELYFKVLLEKYNIKPTKSLGQNFLIDNFALNCIVDALDIKECDTVLEIGGGMGALSKIIAQKTKKFMTVEIDKHLIPCLSDTLKQFDTVKIINADFLEIDVESEIKKYLGFIPTNIKVVGNLPYYITTPILMKVLALNINIDTIVAMVQKEVTGRMTAKPGTSQYGPLAVALQYFFQPEILFNVPPHCFYPKPKVSSTVVRFRERKNPVEKVHNKKLFIEVIKSSFEQRRKTLINSLANTTNSDLLNLDKETIKNILDRLNIDVNIRGEALSLEQFISLTNALEGYI